MNCLKVTSLLSVHLDGALELSKSRALAAHLAECKRCSSEFTTLQQTKSMLAAVGRKPAPEDLALKVRLAISRQVSEVRERPFAMLRFRLETALNAFMVPATAG